LNRTLALILVIFTILGAIYSVAVPVFEASDEKWHYPMVKYVADNWALPVQVPGVETAWRQEGSQPPLYYVLAAAATFWINTSDMEVVRHLNPHVDAGATPDGNVNLAVHHPEREAFPWQGTVLAVHLIRFLSVLMGTAAIYLTYLIAHEALPNQPALALGAAAIQAFTPMVIFISASVNNDNLAVPLISLALLMLLRLLRDRNLAAAIPVARYLLLGVVLGLAALTKLGWPALALLTALVVGMRAAWRWSQRPELVAGWSEFFIGGLATGLPPLLVAGWWYWRNWQLYGDITGLNVFKVILGTREVPADLAQLWRERFSFLAGYWGNFGGLNVPLASWTYRALNTLLVFAALGLVVLLLRQILSPRKPLVIDRWSLIICLLWALGVAAPWALLWARDTWSSQGRLVFSALQVWSLLLALGIAGWFPRRWGEWAVGACAVFLLTLAVLAPWVWIRPAYALPEPLTDAEIAAIPHSLEADFGGVMRLLGYGLETELPRASGGVETGGQVEVTLYWEALAPTDRDYTVFVHLLGEGERPVAQRDTFPGLGLLSTTQLKPGTRWADRYVLPVPETAYAPDTAQVEVGLYDADSSTRLPAGSGGDNVRFGRAEVRARPGDVPNPISVDFSGQMELVGYDLTQLVARPGETITLTLHWRGLRQMKTDYTISAQLVNAAQVKAAPPTDSWPAAGAAPTTAWAPGNTIAEARAFMIYPDAAPGIYDVRIVVYTIQEEEIVHLPVIPAGGEMLAGHKLLTKVRVVP
jgi:hypothetical protein